MMKPFAVPAASSTATDTAPQREKRRSSADQIAPGRGAKPAQRRTASTSTASPPTQYAAASGCNASTARMQTRRAAGPGGMAFDADERERSARHDGLQKKKSVAQAEQGEHREERHARDGQRHGRHPGRCERMRGPALVSNDSTAANTNGVPAMPRGPLGVGLQKQRARTELTPIRLAKCTARVRARKRVQRMPEWCASAEPTSRCRFSIHAYGLPRASVPVAPRRPWPLRANRSGGSP